MEYDLTNESESSIDAIYYACQDLSRIMHKHNMESINLNELSELESAAFKRWAQINKEKKSTIV